MKSIFRVGDKVKIQKVETMGWQDEGMDMYIGQVGTVVQVHDDLDCMVDFNDSFRIWWWHPDNLILQPLPNNAKISFGEDYYEYLSIPLDVYEKLLNKEIQITIQAI